LSKKNGKIPFFIFFVFFALFKIMFHKERHADMVTAKNHSKLSSDDLFTAKEVAALLNVSSCTLSRYRTEGTGPYYIDVSRQVKLYPKVALYQWLASKKRKSTSDPGSMIASTPEDFLLPQNEEEIVSSCKRGRPRSLPTTPTI